MIIMTNLRLSRRLRNDRKMQKRVDAIREARIEAAHALMMKLDEAGYDIVKRPSL